MSYSFIVIDKKNELNLDEFINCCGEVCDNFEILYASSNSVNKENIKNFKFYENENSEKIINTLVKHSSKKNLIIIRDVSKFKNLKNLIIRHKENNQIVAFKKQQSKFKAFWFNSIKNTIAKMLSHKLMEIDYSMILYGEITTKVLKNIKSPSVLMRTNNFIGIDYVLLDGGDNYKFAYKKKKLAIATIVPFSIALLMVVLYFVAFKMNATLTAFYFGMIFILLIVSFIFGSKWILNKILGDNITEEARYIEYNGKIEE